MDNNSLAHTKWNCKYHIVFTPKYRRQAIYQKISSDIGQIIRTLCKRKEIEIIQAAALKDHIHLYVAIPPKLSVVVGIALLLTGGADDKTSAENMGGESCAVVLDE